MFVAKRLSALFLCLLSAACVGGGADDAVPGDSPVLAEVDEEPAGKEERRVELIGELSADRWSDALTFWPSPDGVHFLVAMTADGGSAGDLQLVRYDDQSNPVLLASGGWPLGFASDGGSLLVGTPSSDVSETQLTLYDGDGSNPRSVFTGVVGAASLSPTAAHVLLQDYGGQIRMLDLETGELVEIGGPLSEMPSEVTWDASGEVVAFAGGGAIHLLDVDSKSFSTVIPDGEPNVLRVEINLDESRLGFVTDAGVPIDEDDPHDRGQMALFVGDYVDGALLSVRELTMDPELLFFGPQWTRDGSIWCSSSSPDSHRPGCAWSTLRTDPRNVWMLRCLEMPGSSCSFRRGRCEPKTVQRSYSRSTRPATTSASERCRSRTDPFCVCRPEVST